VGKQKPNHSRCHPEVAVATEGSAVAFRAPGEPISSHPGTLSKRINNLAIYASTDTPLTNEDWTDL
jgi:hypothetical protein